MNTGIVCIGVGEGLAGPAGRRWDRRGGGVEDAAVPRLRSHGAKKQRNFEESQGILLRDSFPRGAKPP